MWVVRSNAGIPRISSRSLISPLIDVDYLGPFQGGCNPDLYDLYDLYDLAYVA